MGCVKSRWEGVLGYYEDRILYVYLVMVNLNISVVSSGTIGVMQSTMSPVAQVNMH